MYCREDGTPYYIGKGKGERIHSPSHSVKLPDRERRKFLKTGLSEEESFRHEKYMISVLGRKDIGTGILRNLTDGGGGGTSGRVWGDEYKKHMSELQTGSNNSMYGMTGEKNPFYGKTHSEETIRRISETMKSRYSSGDIIHPWIGRKHSEETKKKISETKRGRKHSEETKRKMSETKRRRDLEKKLRVQ